MDDEKKKLQKQQQAKFYDALGKKIKRYRNSKKMTQDVLSEKSGIAQGYISDIEQGKARITVDAFVNICNALEISTSDVLKDHEKATPIETDILLAISQLESKDRIKLFDTYKLIKEKTIKIR